MRWHARVMVAVGLFLLAATGARAQSSAGQSGDAEAAPLVWHSDYGEAWNQAQAEHKMLLLRFVAGPQPSAAQRGLDDYLSEHPEVVHQMNDLVLLRLPINATVRTDGAPVRLLQHGAFEDMRGNEGLAIIDLAHENAEYYRHVVSAFPFATGKYYRFKPSYLPVILGLPEGTITQRTMVWAVRVHPEHPASTNGVSNTTLMVEATKQSQYQAQIRLQGHHRWETRFHRIRNLLGGKVTPVEVVAESWPNENLLDSCIDCVASWRQSEGHWNAVKQPQSIYGYDIKRGSNGIWYGTGIFASYSSG